MFNSVLVKGFKVCILWGIVRSDYPLLVLSQKILHPLLNCQGVQNI